MSKFEELLAELDKVSDEQTTLAKSLPADEQDDGAIEAAAAEEGAGDELEAPEREGEGNPEDGDAADEDAPLTKSMTLDGKEYEVLDAAELIKSLGELETRLGSQETVLAKALESTLTAMQTQGEMIKSLSARLDTLAGQGRGRKTVLATSEKASVMEPLAKSEPAALRPGEIMAKALQAQRDGALSGADVSRCEIALNNGLPVPADVAAKLS